MTAPVTTAAAAAAAGLTAPSANVQTEEAFRNFVGETFFGMMLKSLRTTQGETAYFNGGQAEEMFRGQLDQTIAARLAESHGDAIAGPMYGAFQRGLDVSV